MSNFLWPPINLGSNCPRCGTEVVWFEFGPGDRLGNDSIRLHCEVCKLVLKQDVPSDDGDERVFWPPC